MDGQCKNRPWRHTGTTAEHRAPESTTSIWDESKARERQLIFYRARRTMSILTQQSP
ncbi:hypothetical protein DESC_600032 [Desulfosarcina cetonica]|nr:hypothetical protein DESC_600032 [Desulfosarcina cetonica]